MRFRAFGVLVLGLSTLIAAPAVAGEDALLSIDHSVSVRSIVPSIAGRMAQIYVRERAKSEVARGTVGQDRVVLFIHGAGTPAEVAFDVPYKDYSWMAFLAKAGYDVFAM